MKLCEILQYKYKHLLLLQIVVTVMISSSFAYMLRYRHFHRSSLHSVTHAKYIWRYQRCLHLRSSRVLSSPIQSNIQEDWDGSGPNVAHLIVKSSKIAPYWIKQLQALEKPVAVSLVSLLTPDNALGYVKPTGEEAKSGTMAKQAVDEKEKHVDKVIIFRCGEFYETYGIDAIMLVAYCGLNPMGNKCRAGCPVKNIQATLDRLTEVGLSAAVYEEIEDSNLNRGITKKPKMKTRVLTQIVSPAYSTYTYNRCLQDEDIEFRINRPIIGIVKDTGGYVFCETHLDERKVVLSERLTPESVQSLLSILSCSEPIYVSADIDIERELPFIQDFSLKVLPGLSSSAIQLGNEPLSSLLLRQISHDMMTYQIDITSFRVTARDDRHRPRPIYRSTALQIGLIPNENVPNLIKHLLTKHAYAYSHRFLYRWILNPPTRELSNQMQLFCQELAMLDTPPVECKPILEGKIVSLILDKQCNAMLFNELKTNLRAVAEVLRQDASYLPSLIAITESESGIIFETSDFLSRCETSVDEIDRIVLCSSNLLSDAVTTDPYKHIPDSFFKQNEELIRGKINVDASDKVRDYYQHLHQTAAKLCQTIHEQYPDKVDVNFDIFENQLFFKLPTSKDSGQLLLKQQVEYEAITVDRSKKYSSKQTRMTTKHVQAALEDYLACIALGPKLVEQTLQSLCDRLSGHNLQAIIQACHLSIIFETIKNHVIASIQRGWQIPQLLDFQEDRSVGMKLDQLSPYWLDRSKATKNDLEVDGIILLTAPNMSGKSTLMRAALVIALLANCGLHAPCRSSSTIPRFDCYFLRTASYDIPAEGKSAFAVEMDDLRIVERDATNRSLVMMDEIGKGTSARDGSAMAAALLEYLSQRAVYTIFATHLHELLSLPLQLARPMAFKTMSYDEDRSTGRVRWNYRLINGKCFDSMAMHTARLCGISENIIQRAYHLREAYDHTFIPTTTTGTTTTATAAEDVNENDGRNESFVPERQESLMSLRYTPAEIIEVMKRIYSPAKPIAIDHQQQAPISFEGRACVYLLIISPSRVSDSNLPDRIYIGETESIAQRLQQHRRRWKEHHVKVIAVQVANKSDARKIESAFIQEFRRQGYDVIQPSDADNVLFSSINNIEFN
jgi:DNA mismatch repair ATPase MutS/predicted GIY-YIG superfamily endonuclease